MLKRMTSCLVVFAVLTPAFTRSGPAAFDEYESFRTFVTVGQAFAGPLGNGQFAVTSLQITNRDPLSDSCEVGVLFHGGFIPSDFPVLFNGEPGPFTSATIPRGGVMRFDMTAPGLVQGPIAVGFRTLAPQGDRGCGPDSLRVVATSYLIDAGGGSAQAARRSADDPAGGPRRLLTEAFSLAANDADSWLCPGFCLAVSTTEGMGTERVRQRLGIAVSSVEPGLQAPPDTRLRIFVYDEAGNRFGDGFEVEVSGAHTTLFPGERKLGFDSEGTWVFCLESPDSEYKVDLTVIRVSQLSNGTPQFEQLIFTDGFESGDLAAWSTGGN